jgi:DNA-binding NtrC family response regulator
MSSDDSTLRARPRGLASEKPGYVIRVVEGPDAGASVTLEASEPGRFLLGTSPVCGLRLTDRTVSRRHCALEATSRGLRVTDLGSTNGTWVGKTSVGEVWLSPPESLVLGDTRLDIARAEMLPLPIPAGTSFGKVLGTSEAMRRLYPLCERLAKSDVPLVIEGETGTGKEHLAEAIHEASARRDKPYVVFDCTAIAPSLVESELFGHERGAFTGATTSRRGVFERAHGGTLLIDEIGDLPLDLQPKLLRAIERRQVQRVGGDRPLAVDVRVLAATRRDLDQEIQRGRFRDDLFHRLAVARVELPPLRERTGDVALLARRFAEELGGAEAALPDELVASWERAGWPGNVRELRNAVARWLALGDLAVEPPAPRPHAAAASSDKGDAMARVLADELPWTDTRDRVLDMLEARYVRAMLERHGGNVTRAAAAANLARRYFHKLKARHVGGSEEGDE